MLLNMKPIADEALQSTEIESNTISRVPVRNCPELMHIELNKSALEILKQCDGKNTIQSIFNMIRSKYTKVDETQILQDLTETLRFFEKTRLVHYEDLENSAFSDEATLQYSSGLSFSIIEESELLDLIGDTTESLFVNPYYDIPIYLTEENQKTLNFFSIEKTVLVKNNEKRILAITFRIEPYRSSALDIARLYLFDKTQISLVRNTKTDILRSFTKMYYPSYGNTYRKFRSYSFNTAEKLHNILAFLGFVAVGMLVGEIAGQDILIHETIPIELS